MDVLEMQTALLVIGLIVGAAVTWLVKTGRVREAPPVRRGELCLFYLAALCVTLPAVLLLTGLDPLVALIWALPLAWVLLAAKQRISSR